MTYFYWDASALVKRYAPEIGTPIVNAFFSQIPVNQMMCLGICTGEIISIFVRKRNDNTIPQEDFSQALSEFRSEVLEGEDFQVASVNDELIFSSHAFIEQHNINATDALILRSTLDVAEELREEEDRLVLITADQRLLRAAQQEGLQTLNPEVASIEDLAAFTGEQEEGQEEEPQ